MRLSTTLAARIAIMGKHYCLSTRKSRVLSPSLQNGEEEKQTDQANSPAIVGERIETTSLEVFHQEFGAQIGGDAREHHATNNEG